MARDNKPANEEVMPLEEEVSRSALRSRSVRVKMLPGTYRDGGHVCLSEGGVAYWVPEALCGPSFAEFFQLDTGHADIKTLYDWRSEIEAILPTREEWVSNLRESFYRAGAFAKGDTLKSVVRQKLYEYAFPYRVVEEEEQKE